MKYLVAFVLMVMTFAPKSVYASPDMAMLCAKDVVRQYEQSVRATQRGDKFMHCSLSCMIAYECGATQSMAAGVAKEIMDLFGAGNAEIADLKADRVGVKIGAQLRDQSYFIGNIENTCYSRCAEHY